MSISNQTLEKIMRMACLDLSPQEKKNMHLELNNMIIWLEKLTEVNTQNVKPLPIPHHQTNKLRDDVPQDQLPQKEALLNAPTSHNPYFSTPSPKNP